MKKDIRAHVDIGGVQRCQKFFAKKEVMAKVDSLLKKEAKDIPKKEAKDIPEKEKVFFRRYLTCNLVYTNAQRQGAVSNMTLEELGQAEEVNICI